VLWEEAGAARKDWPPALVTLVFTEDAGKTTMTQTVLYSSQAARDGALKTGMEHGAAMSYDRLAELLASMA
jgi:uncharacterized protein YndB with AHSA1/START domain